MDESRKKVLVLALGNDILCDDAVGPHALRTLRVEFGELVDTIEVVGGGLELLDILEGYEKVLLLDSVVTSENSVGTVFEIPVDHFEEIVATSPHYIGLPEALKIARALSIPLPNEFRILAMVIDNQFSFGESLSEAIRDSLPSYIDHARSILRSWVPTTGQKWLLKQIRRNNIQQIPIS